VVAGSHVGVRLPPSAHRFCHAAFLDTHRISPIIDENDNFALKTGTELRALRRLQREQKPGRYVFMSERGAPMSAVAFRRMVTRLGPAAKMPFGIHPHMLRHSTGFKLANQGVDTRSLQHYLGHKNIQHTVRYSELSPERFRDFWKD
jgi:site-specific recombinase XerD